ncbi:helix-turn-helix transcriptional regulator [Cohnella nanjingensis]|uniref:YafY family transcriptional regulator n=1 Tax=Cohnella nanjingensis TaxID=1387779 RepID=A0A7X0VD34_9BACL|nr:YafY family protein [Cohnella nanjingensis]MBB6669577.1 YafY family transcriptional regulator [Cohnella nanjingensis]
MRADRLIHILNELQSRGRATARELSDKLEVSERTIHRDMEALAASGIPVYAERGSRGGWVLQEGYRSQLTGLTAAEIRALLLLQSSSAVADLDLPGDTAVALRKLASALPPTARDEAEFARRHLHVDGAGWRAPSEPARFLTVVQQAVWEQRKLRIRYAATGHEPRPDRIVAPWGLVAKRQTWYFVARIETADDGTNPAPTAADDLRTFRVSRIEEAHLLEDRFAVPPDFDLAAWWSLSTERFKAALPVYLARVRVRDEALDRLRREPYVHIKTTRLSGSGWVEVDADFHTEDSARTLLLGYGASVSVLFPETLRCSLIGEAKALLALYAGPDSPPQDHGQIKV